MKPTHDIAHSSQREQASLPKETLQHRVVSPSSEIIGEGAAIFTDMMETILNVLDQQIAMAPDTPQSKGLSPSDNQIKGIQVENQQLLIRKKVILIYFYLLWKITG